MSPTVTTGVPADDVLAGLDVLREHDAGQRRGQAGVIRAGFGEGHGGARLVDPRAALGDVLGARALADEREAVGGLGRARLGDGELGLRRLEFAVGDGVLAAQLLLAGEVEPGAVALGLGAAQGGRGGGDLLRARPGLELGEGGRGARQLGAPQGELLLLVAVIQPGDQLAGGDAVALRDRALDDAPGHLEAELGVGDLDVAGDDQVAARRAGTASRRRRARAPRPRRPPRPRGGRGDQDAAGAVREAMCFS